MPVLWGALPFGPRFEFSGRLIYIENMRPGFDPNVDEFVFPILGLPSIKIEKLSMRIDPVGTPGGVFAYLRA